MASSGNSSENIDLSSPPPSPSCMADSNDQRGPSPTPPRPPHLPHPFHPTTLPEQTESVVSLSGSSELQGSAENTGRCCRSSSDGFVSIDPSSPPTVLDFSATSASPKRSSSKKKEEEKKNKEEGLGLDLALDLDRAPSVGRRKLDLDLDSSPYNRDCKWDYPRNSDYYKFQPTSGSRSTECDQSRLLFGLSRRWSTVDLSFEDCDSLSPRRDSTPNLESQFERESFIQSDLDRSLFCSVSTNPPLWFLPSLLPSNSTRFQERSRSLRDNNSVLRKFTSVGEVSENLVQRSVSLPDLRDENLSLLDQIHGWAALISYLSQHKLQAGLNITDNSVEREDYVQEDRPKLKHFRAFSSFSESITEEEDDLDLKDENFGRSSVLQRDCKERNLNEDFLCGERNCGLSNLDPRFSTLPQEYMNNNPASYPLFGTLRSEDVEEIRPRHAKMKRSSSEGRTRARTRFNTDMESQGVSDKRLSDSEGSDTHSQTPRGRTSAEKKFRSNGTRSKKPNVPPAGNSAVPVRQRTTRVKLPKQPEGQGTPATQRKPQQRRILPSVAVTQQKAFSKDANGPIANRTPTIRRQQYTRSQTMPIIEKKTDSSTKAGDKVSRINPTKTAEASENPPSSVGRETTDPVSNETTQRRSILRVMRRPTEVSDAQIFTMKPSDVRLNNGVWSEAKQMEDENEVDEEMMVASVNTRDSEVPNVHPRGTIIPKPVAQPGDDQREEIVEGEVVPMSYSVESQPSSVITSTVIHLTNSSIPTGEGDAVDNQDVSTIDTNNYTSNGVSLTPHQDENLDNNNIQSEINSNSSNNNDVDQPDANSLEHIQEISVSPSSPSKSNSEPLLNTEDNAGLETSGSTFRRPKETTKSRFSASEDHLSGIPRLSRAAKSAPTTPAQGNAPVFPKSPTGSDGNSSGGGSNASISLPPGAPWAKETWTSRKRYEIAHSDHDHFLTSLSSLNQYARDLGLENPKVGLKNQAHAHDHAHCYHHQQQNGSPDLEHFRTDHHCVRDHGKVDNSVLGPYLTPRQRLEKETRMLRREVSKLLRENEQKEAEVFALKCQVDGEKKIQDSEKDEQIILLTEKLGMNEKERYLDKEALCKAQEEMSDLNDKYVELERQMEEQKAKYDEYLLGMYRKGQEAARFEREQELDYLLANSKNVKKAGVSLTELSRKLFRTEGELARWQALRLSETYNSPSKTTPSNLLKIRNNHHSLLDPSAASDADVTLAFVRDGFFHLLTDPIDREQHMRALLKIFAYPEGHLDRVKKGLVDFKNMKVKKVFPDAK